MLNRQKEDIVKASLTHKDFFYRFPCFCRPKKDELLSSWIYRLAHRHNIKVYTFCKRALRQSNIWNRDVDKNYKFDLIRLLTQRNGIIRDLAYQTTLKSFEGKLFGKINPYGNTKWIIPYGIYHRKRKLKGLQYCPSCLRKEDPYYNKHWRLSLWFCCHECGLRLLNDCPKCKEPIAFFRQDVGYKNHLQNSPIYYCSSCNFDLRYASTQIVNPDTVYFQRQLYKGLQSNFLFGKNTQEMLSVLRAMVYVLTSKNERSGVFQQHILDSNPNFELPVGMRFDILNPDIREQLLLYAYELIKNWPHNFLSANRYTKSTSTIWLHNHGVLPNWFESTVRENLFIN